MDIAISRWDKTEMLRRPPEMFGPHRVAAAPGTHAQLAGMVLRHASRSARILDLGCWSGALIARLRSLGYDRITAADLANHLTVEIDDFVECDFNSDFAANFAGQRFDAIVASEVIEHLDDPRAFLRQCRDLLGPGGLVFLSTPNVAFFEGRLKFLLTGELWGFGAESYASQRHISPVFARHWPLMARECGFEPLEIATGASFATPLRRVLTAPLWIPMRLALGRRILGETLFLAARAKAGEAAPAGREPWT